MTRLHRGSPRTSWLAASLVALSSLLAYSPAARADGPKPVAKKPAPPQVATLPPLTKPAPAARSGLAAEMRRMSDAFADVAEKISPSVVQIDVTVGVEGSSLQWMHSDGIKRGMGSGVVFSGDGAILTNNHVIEDARSINVRMRDGRSLPARLVGRDPATDLAVIRVDAKGLPAANFGDSDSARVGEWVLAIGSPFGLGYTITTGVLSAKGRGGVGINAVEDYLQTDASINPGNSGGPLVNLDGQVLGINTMIVSKGQGIGLAVPASMARRVADQILKTGRVDRAWIGVGVQDLTPQLAAEIPSAPAMGALVNSVVPSGPAAKAHVEPGDVITQFGGKPVRDAQDIIREVFAHDVKDAVTLEVIRAGKHYQTKVALESRNEPAPPQIPVERQPTAQPGLGISMRDLTDPEGATRGATITQVTAVMTGSSADQAGLRSGDVILECDGVHSPTSAQVQTAAQVGHVLLRIRRQTAHDSATFYTAIHR